MNKSSFFIIGQHAVIEALRNPKRMVLRGFLTEESNIYIFLKSLKKNILSDVKVYFKTIKELDKYSTKENLLHQGYVAEIEHIEFPILKDFIKEKNNITLVCLDGVTDPRNIGSLIRSAAAFGIEGIIIKERNFPNDSKLMFKAASGAIEYMNIFEVSNINSTLKNLKDKNFWVYGFDGNGEKNFTDIEWKGNNILLFGSEGSGMHEHTSKYADFLVKINISEKIESLNISNSAAIAFHHLSDLKKNS